MKTFRLIGTGALVSTRLISGGPCHLAQVLGFNEGADCYIQVHERAAFTRLGTTASGSKIVTGMTGLSYVRKGMRVTGTGMAADTQVENVLSETSIELNYNATASHAGVTLTFDALTAGDVPVSHALAFAASSYTLSFAEPVQMMAVTVAGSTTKDTYTALAGNTVTIQGVIA